MIYKTVNGKRKLKFSGGIKLALGSYYVNRVSRKCYDSVSNMPIFNWWQINETGDLSYLFIKRKMPSKHQLLALSVIWKRLGEDAIDLIGANPKTIAIKDKERQILRLRLEMMSKNKPINQTFIKIKTKKEVEAMRKAMANDHKQGYYETKGYVEKEMGFRIDPTSCTVQEFYNYVNQVNKSLEARDGGRK